MINDPPIYYLQSGIGKVDFLKDDTHFGSILSFKKDCKRFGFGRDYYFYRFLPPFPKQHDHFLW